MGIVQKNPIQKSELEEYRKSLKIGDCLHYYEPISRNDGIGSRVIKRKMEIIGIHRNLVTLRLGGMVRSMTIQEALIYNRNRNPSPQEPVKAMPVQERNYKIMDLCYRGMKQVEIAKRMNCSVQTVNDVVRAATDKRKQINARHAQIMKLTKKGYTSRDIAKKLGCSNATVTRVRKKYAEVSEGE